MDTQMPNVPPTISTPPRPTPPPMPVTPPPSYTPPQKPVSGGHHSGASVILPALLVILLIGAGYYWYSGRTPSYVPPVTTTQPTATSSAIAPGVNVTQWVTASTSLKKIPTGFPTNIPVETTNIIESYSAEYSDHRVVQYTVTYASQKAKADLVKTYTDFFTTAGYTLDTTTTNKANGFLSATKGKDSLNITVTSEPNGSFVQIALLSQKA